MRANRVQPELDVQLAARFKRPLELLLDAAKYAERTSGDPWEFAIEIQRLQELGLSDNDLRFLVRLDYVDHASELKVLGTIGRRFKTTGDLYFTRHTCFVLKKPGIVDCTRLLNVAIVTGSNAPAIIRLSDVREQNSTCCQPKWDKTQRVLYFADVIVKRFKWHSPNQEMILSVFQEEGWPVRIDDPLAPLPTLEIERRLSDTIKWLNRKQQNKLINFHGDGTGHGVLWEAAVENRPSVSQVLTTSSDSLAAPHCLIRADTKPSTQLNR